MKLGEVRRAYLLKVSSRYFSNIFKPVVKQMDSNKLLNVHCLEEILPESICLNLRAELAYKELSCKELSHESQKNSFDLTENSTDTGKFVVDLPGVGTVDRNGLQDMIKLHNLRKTVKEVEDERLWVTKAESQLSSNIALKELLQPVKEYANTLWSSGEKDKAFGINIKDTMRLACDRWFSDDVIECFFSMLDALSEEYIFLVFDPPMNNPSHLLQRAEAKLSKTTKYLHFALNVKCTGINLATAIGNGNHWVYVLVTTNGENIIQLIQKRLSFKNLKP